MAATAPSRVGLNDELIAPVVASNATMNLCPLPAELPGGPTEVKEPPAIMVSPTWAIARTLPPKKFGVLEDGTTEATPLCVTPGLDADAVLTDPARTSPPPRRRLHSCASDLPPMSCRIRVIRMRRLRLGNGDLSSK